MIRNSISWWKSCTHSGCLLNGKTNFRNHVPTRWSPILTPHVIQLKNLYIVEIVPIENLLHFLPDFEPIEKASNSKTTLFQDNNIWLRSKNKTISCESSWVITSCLGSNRFRRALESCGKHATQVSAIARGQKMVHQILRFVESIYCLRFHVFCKFVFFKQ